VATGVKLTWNARLSVVSDLVLFVGVSPPCASHYSRPAVPAAPLRHLHRLLRCLSASPFPLRPHRFRPVSELRSSRLRCRTIRRARESTGHLRSLAQIAHPVAAHFLRRPAPRARRSRTQLRPISPIRPTLCSPPFPSPTAQKAKWRRSR